MVERKITTRLATEGGGQVTAEFTGIGRDGKAAFEKIEAGAKSAQKSARVFERQLAAEERAFKALKASVDPAYAAMQRMNKVQAQVTRAVRSGIVTQREADKVMAQYTARTRGMSAAMNTVEGAAVRMNGGLRNSLLQINQIGQQAAVTGDLMGAVAIQLPDILGGFGSLPLLIAGAAAGFGATFIPQLLGARKEAQALEVDLQSAYSSAETALSAARTAQDRYTAAIRLSGAAQSQVTPQILNGLALEAKAREALANLEKIKLENRKKDAESALSSAQSQLDTLLERATRPYELAASTARDLGQQQMLAQALEYRAAAEADVLAKNDELVQSVRQQQAELDLVNALLQQNWGEAANLVDELAAAASEGSTLSGVLGALDISGVGSQAAFLAVQMGVAADEAARYNAALNRSAGIAAPPASSSGLSYGLASPDQGQLGVGFANLGYGNLDAPKPPRTRTAQRTPASVPSRRGGGGSSRGAATRISDEARAAQRIFDSTRTALENYNKELAQADALLASGAISQDTYNRYVDQLSEKLNKASDANKALQQVSQQAKDAIIDGALGQANSFDQLAQSIKRAAVEYALFGTGLFAPKDNKFVGILGGLLKGFDNEGYTGSGPRSGGLDGKGGFLAMLHPGEDVRRRDRRGSASQQGSGGGMVFAVDSGVKATWMSESQMRAAQMDAAGFTQQRRAMPGMLDQMNMRGVS